MKCPYCGKDNTRVIDSRPADDGDSIRRRRECDECHKRFTTYEKVETIPMIVIKKIITERLMTGPRSRAGCSVPVTRDRYQPHRSKL